MKLSVREAEAEAADVHSWNCESCDTMVEDGQRYCLPCKTYWDDVADGLFELPIEEPL
jgi:hypothetical protein